MCITSPTKSATKFQSQKSLTAYSYRVFVIYLFVIHNISQLSTLTTRALDMRLSCPVCRTTRLSWRLVCSGFAHFVDDIKDEPLARYSYALDIRIDMTIMTSPTAFAMHSSQNHAQTFKFICVSIFIPLPCQPCHAYFSLNFADDPATPCTSLYHVDYM